MTHFQNPHRSGTGEALPKPHQFMHWLDNKLDAAAADLASLSTLNGPGFVDTASRLVDLMNARSVFREFIATKEACHDSSH